MSLATRDLDLVIAGACMGRTGLLRDLVSEISCSVRATRARSAAGLLPPSFTANSHGHGSAGVPSPPRAIGSRKGQSVRMRVRQCCSYARAQRRGASGRCARRRGRARRRQRSLRTLAGSPPPGSTRSSKSPTQTDAAMPRSAQGGDPKQARGAGPRASRSPRYALLLPPSLPSLGAVHAHHPSTRTDAQAPHPPSDGLLRSLLCAPSPWRRPAPPGPRADVPRLAIARPAPRLHRVAPLHPLPAPVSARAPPPPPSPLAPAAQQPRARPRARPALRVAADSDRDARCAGAQGASPPLPGARSRGGSRASRVRVDAAPRWGPRGGGEAVWGEEAAWRVRVLREPMRLLQRESRN